MSIGLLRRKDTPELFSFVSKKKTYFRDLFHSVFAEDNIVQSQEYKGKTRSLVLFLIKKVNVG